MTTNNKTIENLLETNKNVTNNNNHCENAKILPKQPTDVITVAKQIKPKYDEEEKLSICMIRKKNVMNALFWLKLHNSEYLNISIKKEHLDCITEEP